ncbi:DUF4411 family protein [Rhizobium leguminosarum]|uniref:DUF4411 family protein n=2 Tax=Rhizobium leguminosarum TaxID=384 RepID=A0A154IHE9_RHILE|nr:DUF4411 family protein [Rhizobium leguminosarum]KZA99962.1 hypothetical protein A4A59_19495 [Rhizobium leguminosarum]NKJ79637.1 DUF4411 family protein [Rhizobium leguminosarum bv. viciae]
MVKRYCFDTSGISNPLETMPADIHVSLWASFSAYIYDGFIAVTPEIYDEMCHVTGDIGDMIKSTKGQLVLELGGAEWDWQTYVNNSKQLLATYEGCISEYTGGSAKTICLNDMTIVCLAKTLGLPLVSMENLVKEESQTNKRKIPNICRSEGIEHLTFSDFLRRENLSF